MTHLAYSLGSFFIAVFFILLGLIGVMIPWSTDLRTYLVLFILENSIAISLFSFAFIVIGLAIACHILVNSKKHYYHIQSGKNRTSIDEKVIENHLNVYWKQLFPKKNIACELKLKNNKISIAVDFPAMSIAQQQLLVERVKRDLHGIFEGLLGPYTEFKLSASFPPET